jgi:hypothetical protein
MCAARFAAQCLPSRSGSVVTRGAAINYEFVDMTVEVPGNWLRLAGSRWAAR